MMRRNLREMLTPKPTDQLSPEVRAMCLRMVADMDRVVPPPEPWRVEDPVVTKRWGRVVRRWEAKHL